MALIDAESDFRRTRRPDTPCHRRTAGQREWAHRQTLAEPFPVSLPAVIRHLDVLCDAGPVTRQRTGRTVTCRLSVGPMSEAMAWLDRHVRFLEARGTRRCS